MTLTPEALIEKFYTSFSKGNAQEMISCYHKNVAFKDPAFGRLEGDRAKNMWRMLLSQKSETTKIHFENIKASKETGSAKWVAEYLFGDKKRKVVNHVQAKFKFKDGLIIEHIDSFNMWTWSKQALGFSGYLLGWTPLLKSKIQKTTNQNIDEFLEKEEGLSK